MENETIIFFMEKEEDQLYKEAEARVKFKSHLRIYIAVNLLMWAFWYLFNARFGRYGNFWPIFGTLGWGFGIFTHYQRVYSNNKGAIEREIEKIKRERELKDKG